MERLLKIKSNQKNKWRRKDSKKKKKKKYKNSEKKYNFNQK
jgi:hypothetical protein